MKRFNMYLPDKLLENYVALGKTRGISAAEVVRIAMEKYLQALERAQKSTPDTQNAG